MEDRGHDFAFDVSSIDNSFLFYALAKKAGLSVRIIDGVTNEGEPHASDP